MKLHTQEEFLDTNQYFIYRLRNLFDENQEKFYDLAHYLPNLVYVSKEKRYSNRESVYLYHNNNKLLQNIPEVIDLFTKGLSFMQEYSCPVLSNHLIEKVNDYKSIGDIDTTVSYFQYFKFDSAKIYLLTHKIFTHQKNVFLNFSDNVEDLPSIGKIFTDVFEYYHRDFTKWKLFQSLTKQEKKVIKYLCNGFTNSQVSDMLFVSIDTIKTHRKNIYRKLNINSMAEMVKVSLILDLENPNNIYL